MSVLKEKTTRCCSTRGMTNPLIQKGSVMAIVRISEPVRKFVRVDSRGDRYYKFAFYRCDCGKEFERRCDGADKVNSCGCYRAKKLLQHVRGNTYRKRHGAAGTPVYQAWFAMHDRCRNPKSHAYDRYGGRGVKVCEEWNDFAVFLEQMGERPHGMSLDRIDNDGGYCKENCRWATMSEQANNRRSCIYVTVDGVTKTAAAWSREPNTRGRKAIARLAKLGVEGREAVYKS